MIVQRCQPDAPSTRCSIRVTVYTPVPGCGQAPIGCDSGWKQHTNLLRGQELAASSIAVGLLLFAATRLLWLVSFGLLWLAFSGLLGFVASRLLWLVSIGLLRLVFGSVCVLVRLISTILLPVAVLLVATTILLGLAIVAAALLMIIPTILLWIPSLLGWSVCTDCTSLTRGSLRHKVSMTLRLTVHTLAARLLC